MKIKGYICVSVFKANNKQYQIHVSVNKVKNLADFCIITEGKNNAERTKDIKKLPEWWYEIMRRIRTDSGTTYINELATFLLNGPLTLPTTTEDFLKSLGTKTKKQFSNAVKKISVDDKSEEFGISQNDIVDILNELYKCTKGYSKYIDSYEKFILLDSDTNGLYTLPSQRKILDPLLHGRYDDYVPNEYLYKNIISCRSTCSNFMLNRFTNSNFKFEKVVKNFKTYKKGRIIKLSVDFSLLKKEAHKIQIMNFNLSNELKKYLLNKHHIKDLNCQVQILDFNAANTVFLGKSVFSSDKMSIRFLGKINLSGCVFTGEAFFEGIHFFKNPDNQPLLDNLIFNFRNSVFFGDAIFRDISIASSINSPVVSFEDARFVNNVDFFKCDFRNSKVYFFQTVVGKYNDTPITAVDKADISNRPFIHFKLHGCKFNSEGSLDFDQMEIDDRNFIISNSILYETRITPIAVYGIRKSQDDSVPLQECPNTSLTIEKCEIHAPMRLSNFREVIFKDTHNFSKILEEKNWAKVKYKNYRDFKLGQRIRSPLLMAVYNYGSSVRETKSERKKKNQLIKALLAQSTKCSFLMKTYNSGSSLCSAKSEKELRKKLEKALLKQSIKCPLLMEAYNSGFSVCKTKFIKLRKDKLEKEFAADKARSFLILKESYETIGDYYNEDVAFVLYMKFKEYLECDDNHRHKRRFKIALNGILFWICKYGLSPIRCIIAAVLLVLLFGFIFGLFASLGTAPAFSLGNSLNASWRFGASYTANPCLTSFIYSVENVIPFVSQFEPISMPIIIFTAIENCIGTFIVGYFSVSIVNKTLRSK